MGDMLSEARDFLQAHRKLADLVIHEEEGEFHLFRGDDRFARLIPTEHEGIWRLEYFRNRERWECMDFMGTVPECLAFLAENEHYLFWEG